MDKIDKAMPIGINRPIPRVSHAQGSVPPERTRKSAFQPRPPAPLARKTLAIQGLVLSACALMIVYLMLAVHQLLGAQSVYEAVQQQRILNQRYAKEILLAVSGIPVNYEKTAREWTQATDLLIRGGVIRAADSEVSQKIQPPPDVSGLKNSVQKLVELRQGMFQEANSYLQSAHQDTNRQELFDELYRQSLQLQAAGDALVGTYDKHLDSGVSWWDVNAVAIEMAERQRMLIQQHIKEILFVAHGIPADYQATRLRLYESAKILMEGGQISVDNKEAITIPPPGSADVHFNLQQQKDALDKFTAVSNQYLMLSNQEVERSIQLKRILDLTGEYHEIATKLLIDYRSFFEGRVKRASREAAAAGILTAVFVLVLAWGFIRKYVDRPAAQMAAMLRGLRTGAVPPSASSKLEGPLAEASSELDQCLKQWQSSQKWFDQFLSSQSAEELEDPGSHDPVASRVYQWYRSRESEASGSRWSDQNKNDSQITIIGRLPDHEPALGESELLDQLIQRTNDLRSDHEKISRVRDHLAQEAEALRMSEAGLSEENQWLRNENVALVSQIAEQVAELAQLRTRLEGLQKSEFAINTGADEIRRVNSELLISLDRQSDELRTLRGQLQAKAKEFESALKDARRRDEANHARIEELTRQLSDAEALRARLESELASMDRANQSLTHAHQEEKIIGLRQTDALRAEHEAALAAARAEREAALAVVRAEYASAIQSAQDLRSQLEGVQREVEDARQNSRRDQETISNLRQLLEEAERGLADLRMMIERSMESARRDAEAREALAQRISTLSDTHANLEAVGAEQLRQIHRQEAVVVELQQALARQTRALESLRTELSETVAHHTSELERRNSQLRDSESSLAQSQSQLFETQNALLDTRAQLVETKTQLESRESELWRIRKELSDRQREITEARQDIERLHAIEAQQRSSLLETRQESARLQSILASKTLALSELEDKRRALEGRIAQMESEHLEVRRRLEAELTTSREAHQGKCHALALTEERLAATRTALKSALDELQERSNR